MKKSSNYSGSGINQNNSLSRDLNRAAYANRSRFPSTDVSAKWITEYKNSDLQYIMRYVDFKKIKTKYWRKRKEIGAAEIAKIWRKKQNT